MNAQQDFPLGHRIFIPRRSWWVYNGVSFQADGRSFFEFVPESNPAEDPWTLNADEVLMLTPPKH